VKRRARRAEGRPAAPGPLDLRLAVLAVLLAALAVRIYYFVLTRGQPVWWDEAEYLLAARAAVEGTPMTGFFSGRPMLLSWVLSASFAVGAGELGARVFYVAISFAGVVLVYSVGRRLHGALAGLVAALLFSTIYIHVFYTNRVLTEVPHVTACLLGVDLLLSGRPRRVAWSVPLLVIGALTRFPAALLFFVVALWAALHGRARLLRSRPFLLSLVLGALTAAPYLVWATVTRGDPLFAYKASSFHMPDLGLADGIEGLRFYLRLAYGTLGPVLSAVLAVGVLRALRFVVWPRRVLVDGDPALSAGLLLVVWIATPVLYFSFFLRPLDDRFTILSVPPALIAIGEATAWLAGLVTRRHRVLAPALALAAGAAGALHLVRHTDRLIRNKLPSYGEVRAAGLWLRERAGPGAVVMTRSEPQITYYAGRRTTPLPDDPLRFLARLRAGDVEYVVLVAHEGVPAWLQPPASRGLGLRGLAAFPRGRPLVAVLGVPERLRR
jgi:4-amino-4-deoxy-L-arabinose transferase-like glycosyltransferase